MNFALGLAAGKVRGVSVDSGQLASGTENAQQTLAALENSLLAGDVSKQTHETISKQLDDPKISQRKLDDASHPPNVSAIAGLILGSPEFQKR
jgi:signal recognition particle GTPase